MPCHSKTCPSSFADLNSLTSSTIHSNTCCTMCIPFPFHPCTLKHPAPLTPCILQALNPAQVHWAPCTLHLWNLQALHSMLGSYTTRSPALPACCIPCTPLEFICILKDSCPHPFKILNSIQSLYCKLGLLTTKVQMAPFHHVLKFSAPSPLPKK